MVRKMYSKIHPVSCPNTHHDVTDSVNHGKVKNTKTWISRERNITFLWNKKILTPCLRSHILRSYRFAAEVTFNISKNNSIPCLEFQADACNFIKKETLAKVFSDEFGKHFMNTFSTEHVQLFFTKQLAWRLVK